MRILYNANIHTFDVSEPSADAMLINSGQILAIGEKEDIFAIAPAFTAKTDIEQQTIIPGLTDAHLHLQYYAKFLQQVDCETSTRRECLQRISARVSKTPPGSWVTGHGWNQNNWEEGFGDASLLDTVAPENPVYLTAKSLHASWVNTAALKLAGINADTADPQGGKIGRNADGSPNGLLFENAMQMVERVVPEPTNVQWVDQIYYAQQQLLRFGLTGVHDFDGYSCYETLKTIQQQDRLHLRVCKGLRQADLLTAIHNGLFTGAGDKFLRIGSIKLFADGALGPRTAAMFLPYENEPDNNGLLLLDHEQILEIGKHAVDSGFSLAIHAIGDRANHEVITAYTQLRAYETQKHLAHQRHRLEHAQVLAAEDFSKLVTNSIIASVQPIHAPSDMYAADLRWGERTRYAYAYQTLSRLDTALAFGSDAPVESPNPFLGLYAAVSRRRLDGSPDQNGWHPEQRLTLAQSLHAYTAGPAFAAGLEDKLGKLKPGYWADLIVLPRDPLIIPIDDLPNLLPTATMVGGEWVWSS